MQRLIEFSANLPDLLLPRCLIIYYSDAARRETNTRGPSLNGNALSAFTAIKSCAAAATGGRRCTGCRIRVCFWFDGSGFFA